MSEKNTIVFQSESTFNPGIMLTESNYDVWSQLVEMHIVERENFSYIRVKKKPPKKLESERVPKKCPDEYRKRVQSVCSPKNSRIRASTGKR